MSDGKTESEGREPANAGTEPAPACALVIFGAHGDLTKRLLMPALYNLRRANLLSDDFKVFGVDRVEASDEDWRKELTDTMQSFTKDKTAEFYTPKLDDDVWNWIRGRLSYIAGDFTKGDVFQHIGEAVKGQSAIFYLAISARFFGTVVDGLGNAKLLEQEGDGEQFRRVVLEKPFGADLPSAKALNEQILKQADESQYYRIDHFLGKESVQSIMAMRFANGMFEPLWRREHIDHVEITAAETVGVEQRGAFYEPTGALRDMVPNHLFTLLSMVTMEPPNSFDAEDVRSEKAKLMEAVRPIPPGDAVRGQYTAGKEFGENVPGYREENGVAKDSRTETYIAVKLAIENWRWSGVPFYLRTGKRMTGRRTEIAVHFRPAPYQMFRDTPVDKMVPNVMRFLIDPVQGIATDFDAKVPGPQMKLGRVETRVLYKDFFDEQPNVGYETLLYDCMRGDATLFQRADYIEASWAAVQPLLESWGKGEGQVEDYPAGSPGPKGADDLLARDGNQWLPIEDKGDDA